MTITPLPNGTPVVLRTLSTLASPSLPLVGTYGEFDLDLVATYTYGATGMGIDIAGTVTRVTAGTQTIRIDVEGGWGVVLPEGGGAVSVSGFATGAALVQQGGAMGVPVGASPAQDILYTAYPANCFEPIYGPRPPGNPGGFDCKSFGGSIEAGAVAVRSVTVVSINEVGDLVDLPARVEVGTAPGSFFSHPGVNGLTFQNPVLLGSILGIQLALKAKLDVNVEVNNANVTEVTCSGPPGATATPSGGTGCDFSGQEGDQFTMSAKLECPSPQEYNTTVRVGSEEQQIAGFCVSIDAPGSLRARIFEDLNANSVCDGPEIGLNGCTTGVPNWQVFLDNEPMNGSPDAYADADGLVELADLPPGVHTLTFGNVPGWYFSVQNSGSFVVRPGEVTTIFNGVFRLTGVAGFVWEDSNGNGIWDNGELPLSNWPVTCTGPNCDPPLTFTTDATGAYGFYNLVPGNFELSSEAQQGHIQSFPTDHGGTHPVTPLSAQPLEGINFGFEPASSSNEFDWGDAPESVPVDLADKFPSGYPTTAGNNGAYHPIDLEVRLGPTVDAETDGQPSYKADGDDMDAEGDDDDGVSFTAGFFPLEEALNPGSEETTIVPGQLRGTTAEVVLLPSLYDFLNAWVDWNRDGDWEDDGERLYSNLIIGEVSEALEWPIPLEAEAGYTYARFRFSREELSSPGGVGGEGEVEDYLLKTLDEQPAATIDEPVIPAEYRLYQNYPNPFNPTTNIRFTVTVRQWVRLEVYDMLGKKVRTLVNGWVEAGESKIEFDARDLPSGMYVYQMTAGSFTQAKQLTLLK